MPILQRRNPRHLELVIVHPESIEGLSFTSFEQMASKGIRLPVSIPYGEKSLSVTLPQSALLYKAEPRAGQRVADLSKEIARAVRHPIGVDFLRDVISQSGDVLILTDDNTRATPLKEILPAVIDELNRIGIQDGRISILIATGTHRPLMPQELDEKFSRAIQNRVEISQHCYTDDHALVKVGETKRGIPIRINRKAIQCGTLIGIGSIVPHCDAGYSGGAKIVQPGIGGYEITAYTRPKTINGQIFMLIKSCQAEPETKLLPEREKEI